MTSKEIIKHLEREGWEFRGQSGSHSKWRNPITGDTVIVPHPKKDFSKGTLKAIFKQASWDK